MIPIFQTLKTMFNNDKNYGVIEKNRDTITKLKFICSLQQGEKVDVKNLKIEHNNILTPVKRLIFGESRDTTLNFLNNTIERSFEIIQAYCNSERKSEKIFCINIINDLIKSIYGLKNIQFTYKEDKLFYCNIDILIENIQGKIIELKEKYNDIFEKDSISEFIKIINEKTYVDKSEYKEVNKNNENNVNNLS